LASPGFLAAEDGSDVLEDSATHKTTTTAALTL
jgi:hypothetical protein